MATDFGKRLERLEKLIKTKENNVFIVVLKDGRRRTIPPGDCIPLIVSGEVVDIEGMDSEKNGKLFSLLKGIIEGERSDN